MREKLTMLCQRLAICALITVSPCYGVLTRSAASEPEVLEVEDCRIKLIDHVELAADRGGIIANIKPVEGDRVKRQDLVAKLHDEVALAALKSAEHAASNNVQVQYAEASSKVAWTEHRKALLTNRQFAKTVPDVEVDRLKLAAERSDLEIEQAEHDLQGSQLNRDEVKAQLQTHRIYAPFDGVVTRVIKSPGEAVTQGDPILEIVNPDRLRVEGFIELKDAWRIKADTAVSVQLDIPDVELEVESETLEGKLVFVNLSVEPVLNKVRVWAEVINRDDLLRAGLTAKMTIHLSGDSDKTAALQR